MQEYKRAWLLMALLVNMGLNASPVLAEQGLATGASAASLSEEDRNRLWTTEMVEANLLCQRRKWHESAEIYKRCLVVARSIADKSRLLVTCHHLADVYDHLGEAGLAAQILEEACSESKSDHSTLVEQASRRALAKAYKKSGKSTEARAQEALAAEINVSAENVDDKVERLKNHLLALWSAPTYKELCSAKIECLLSRNGRVTLPLLIKSSGNPTFDQSALAALVGLDPLPKLEDTNPPIPVIVTFKTRLGEVPKAPPSQSPAQWWYDFASRVESTTKEPLRDVGETVNLGFSSRFALTGSGAITVGSIRPGSWASRVGLHEGDKIISFDGKQASDFPRDDIATDLFKFYAGEKPILQVHRNGKVLDFTVDIKPEDYPTAEQKRKIYRTPGKRLSELCDVDVKLAL